MTLASARDLLHRAQRVAVLSGAGISAASGIATFRGAQGMWRKHRPEQLASPEGYARNPTLVWEWYLSRLTTVQRAKPNGAHYALVQLASSTQLTIVTQNVDGLHQRAGSKDVLELHGSITRSRCEACAVRTAMPEPAHTIPHCPRCGKQMRPDVVWFGEMLPEATFQRAIEAFSGCDVALIIGTSGVVEPAASLARLAKQQGAYCIEINPRTTPLSDGVDYHLAHDAVNGMRQLMAQSE